MVVIDKTVDVVEETRSFVMTSHEKLYLTFLSLLILVKPFWTFFVLCPVSR